MLSDIGRRIAATMLEMFRDVVPGHVLFDQYSFIAADELQDYAALLGRIEAGRGSEADEARLVGLALLYAEPRHRLGLLDATLENRILTARSLFRQRTSSDTTQAIAFYDPQGYCPPAPLRDNLLFGLAAHDGAADIIRDVLAEFGLAGEVYRRGLEQPAGYAGRLLFPAMKTQIALARCLIKQPRLLILNNAFGAFGHIEARQIRDRIRSAMAGNTLIVAGRDIGPDEGYDLRIAFEGARLAPAGQETEPASAAASPVRSEAAPGPADNDELRILQSVPIFRELDVARLKLLAFTSERVVFAEGDVLFRQGDESDAAYVLLSGTADIVVMTGGDDPVRVSSVARNAFVGEMGLVTDEPRSATVVATSVVEALRLRKDVFLAMLAEFPPMALSIMRLMVKRLQDNAVAARHGDGRGAPEA
jgi:putative ABC transport system ATP-binding protein